VDVEICESTNSEYTLRYGDEWLEDICNPTAAAADFVDPKQIEGAKHVVLFGLGLGYRVERLRELGHTKPVVFEPCKEIYDATMDRFRNRLGDAEVFHEIPPMFSYLVANTGPRDTMSFVGPPSYKRAFPKECREIESALREIAGITVVRENTVTDRVGLIIENMLNNLDLLETTPLALSIGRPLRSTPAFIVSAGPSLDRNAHLLKEASKHGAIFTVNTAAPAVVAADTEIDALVGIESLDVSKHLAAGAPHAKSVILDLSSNRINFSVPCRRQLTYFYHNPSFVELITELGAESLIYGGSVSTAAFSLAFQWGANPTVLLGQDLAYTGGRSYASNTLYEDMRVEKKGNVIEMFGCEKQEEVYKKNGLKTNPRRRPAIDANAWGREGMVPTTHDLMLFRHWFEAVAYHINGKSERRLINATEGGISLRGYEEMTLRQVLDQYPERGDTLDQDLDNATVVDKKKLKNVSTILSDNARELAIAAKKCSKAGRNIRKGKIAEAELRAAAKKAPMAEALAAPKLTLLRKNTEMSREKRAKATYEIIRDAANGLIKIIRQ
jgi:hypothetical protein